MAKVELSGCTIIGYGIGSAVRSDAKAQPAAYVDEVAKGTTVSLLMEDGAWLDGTYAGTLIGTDEAYAEAYAQWWEQDAAEPPPPLLGAPVTATLASGSTVRGAFQGFDYDKIYFQRDTGGRALPLTDVAALASREGPVYPTTVLYLMTTEGDVPLRTTHRIKIQENLTSFDLRRVQQVHLPGSTYEETGLVIGLAIDVGILLVGFAAWNDLRGFDLEIY